MKHLKNLWAIITLALYLVVGCSKDDGPKSAPAKFSVDQSSIDFNEVEIGALKNVKVVVTNSGQEDLALKDFALSGANASEFSVNAGETEKTIQASETYEFVISFGPTEEGDKTAILTITSNVGEHKINLSGKGTPVPMAVFSIDPESKDFGDVEVSTEASQIFTITNTGQQDLILKDYAISGSNASVFSVDASEMEETVQAGKTYEFVVTFKPMEVGDKMAMLTITSTIGEHNVNLSGKGTPEPVAVFSIDPESKDFGDVMLENKAVQNFTVTNTGNADLIISETTLGGTNAGAYSSTINPVTVQQGGATYGFEVAFSPQTMGAKTATISIVTNIGTYTVNLEGNGIPNPDIVYVPDANFKASILAHGTAITGAGISKIDINDDGKIQVSEAEAYEGTIFCVDRGITDLTGIEDFVNITTLNVANNQISVLDASKNTNLKVLHAYGNKLTNIDVSQNIALAQLHCSDNQLSTIDVSSNTALQYLWLERNKLTSLDVSQNTALKILNCRINQLSGLDVSQNTLLNELKSGYNQLTGLDVTNNIALSILEVEKNMLSGLDVSQNVVLGELLCSDNNLSALNVSNNTSLKILWAHNNTLTSLDVTQNTVLEYLHCYGNELTTLNLASGSNNNLTRMLAANNNLSCIQIDEGFTPPDDGTWSKDDTANYNTNCL